MPAYYSSQIVSETMIYVYMVGFNEASLLFSSIYMKSNTEEEIKVSHQQHWLISILKAGFFFFDINTAEDVWNTLV